MFELVAEIVVLCGVFAVVVDAFGVEEVIGVDQVGHVGDVVGDLGEGVHVGEGGDAHVEDGRGVVLKEAAKRRLYSWEIVIN